MILGLSLVALLVTAFLVVTFNSLTRLRQLSRNAWADIDVQLKRRHDLVPLLVDAVRGHAGYERGTLESAVTTITSCAPSMLWLLVMTMPEGSTSTPEPSERAT